MAETHHPEPDGERITAGALFRAHARFIAKFVQHLGVPLRDVDDLVQDVFMTVHRKGGYVTGPAQPRTWLASIAARIAQNNRRAQRRLDLFTTRLAAEELVPAAADPVQQVELQRGIARVQRALELMPLEQRAAFVLYELEGESCESIAASWEVPIGTIYSRLHHARRAFVRAYASGVEPSRDKKAMGGP